MTKMRVVLGLLLAALLIPGIAAAQFTIPNYSTATYKAQAAPDSGDFAILTAAIKSTGVVSGCGVTPQGTPDMTVAVASGVVQVLGVAATVTGANATITAADATHARIDLVTANASGVLSVVAGTPAATPEFPSTSNVVLAAVYVPATASSIVAGNIIDKRAVLASRINLVQTSAGVAAAPLIFTDDLVKIGRANLGVPWLGVFLNGAQTHQFTATSFDLISATPEVRLGAASDLGLKRLAAGSLKVYDPGATTTQAKTQLWGGYGSYVETGEIHEAITLSTSGTTTDTAANLLPANAIIEGVAVRVTTEITGSGVTHFNVGDASDADRFAATVALASGTSAVGLLHVDQTGASGPLQVAAAKLRITAVGGTPTAGAVRVIVYYRLWTVPSS